MGQREEEERKGLGSNGGKKNPNLPKLKDKVFLEGILCRYLEGQSVVLCVV